MNLSFSVPLISSSFHQIWRQEKKRALTPALSVQCLTSLPSISSLCCLLLNRKSRIQTGDGNLKSISRTKFFLILICNNFYIWWASLGFHITLSCQLRIWQWLKNVFFFLWESFYCLDIVNFPNLWLQNLHGYYGSCDAWLFNKILLSRNGSCINS